MQIDEETRKRILQTVDESGEYGVTLKDILRDVDLTRHTLSKYLYLMQKDGLLRYRQVGKAKLWFINKNPIKNIFEKDTNEKTMSEKLLTSIVKNIPTGLVMTDNSYGITFMNKYAVDMYGKLQGENFASSALGLKDNIQLDNFIEKNTKEPGRTLEIEDKFGNIVILRFSQESNPDGSTSYLFTVNDISKIKDVEKLVEQRANQQHQSALFGIASMIAKDKDTVLEQAVKVVKDNVDADYVKILKYDSRSDSLIFREGAGWDEDHKGEKIMKPTSQYQSGYTYNSTEPVIVKDFENEARFKPSKLLKDAGVKSGLSVTISGRESPYGVLAVHSRVADAYNENDISFMQSIANIIGGALDRLNYEKELERSSNEFKMWIENSPDMIARIDQEGVITYVNPTFEKVLGVDRNKIIGSRIADINAEWHSDVSEVLNTGKPLQKKYKTENGDLRANIAPFQSETPQVMMVMIKN